MARSSYISILITPSCETLNNFVFALGLWNTSYSFSKSVSFFFFFHSHHSKGCLPYQWSLVWVADKGLWKHLAESWWSNLCGLSLLCAAWLGCGALASMAGEFCGLFFSLWKTKVLLLLTLRISRWARSFQNPRGTTLWTTVAGDRMLLTSAFPLTPRLILHSAVSCGNLFQGWVSVIYTHQWVTSVKDINFWDSLKMYEIENFTCSCQKLAV